MAKKPNWDEYNIRTLAYYQKQGGVYSDLITVLQKARTEKSVVGYIPKKTPARLLNIASYIADLAMTDKTTGGQLIVDQKQQYANRLGDDQMLVFSIVYILIGDTDCEEANRQLMEYVGRSKMYQSLHNAYAKEAAKGKSTVQEVLPNEEKQRMEEVIQMLNTTVADQGSQIFEMQNEISRLTREKELAQAAVIKESKLDRMLTLDYIIGQIELRRTYENSSQLIDLLKGKLIRIATDEEVAKIERIEQKMLDASVPSIHNTIKDSNVIQGTVHNPTFRLPIGFTEEMLNAAMEQYLKQKNNGEQE